MKTLLLLEDDESLRKQLVRALNRQGFQCVEAEDLQQGQQQLLSTSHLYGAVLDMNLGTENGIDLIQPLLQQHPQCRIVILTGYGSISSAVQAIHKGAWNYLPKPASASEIIHAMEQNPANNEVGYTDSAPSLDRLEWEHIQRVLDDHDGNISAAARVLGIHRRTLQRRLKKRPAAQDYKRDK